MQRSGYITLYLLQYIKLEMTTAVETYTRDSLADDTMFPDNGPVFMHKLHDVTHHPMRDAIKVKRRFEDYDIGRKLNAPGVNFPAYDYNAEGKLANVTREYKPVFMEQFVDAKSSITKNIEEFDDPRIKEYDDIIESLNSTRENKTDLVGRADSINQPATENTNEKFSDPPVNNLNYPRYVPKIFDDIYSMDRGSSTQRLRDFLTNELPFIQNYDEFTSTDKNFRTYAKDEEVSEPIFVDDFNFTPQTTGRVKIFNRTVLKKMQDWLYPVEKKLGGQRFHKYRKNGELLERSTTQNKSQATAKRLVGDRKNRPALIQNSDAQSLGKPILRMNSPLLNDLAIRQGQAKQYNPTTIDGTIEKINKPQTLRPNDNQDYDIKLLQQNLPSIQRVPGTQKNIAPFKSILNVTYSAKTEKLSSKFDRPLTTLHEDYEVSGIHPRAEEIISSEFLDTPDIRKPPPVQKLNRSPSFTNASVTSLIVSLLNTNPPASQKLIESNDFIPEASKAPFTVTNLVSSSSANALSIARQRPLLMNDRISYPWIKTLSYLTSKKARPVVTTFAHPLITSFILRSTTEYSPMVYVPCTTTIEEYQEIKPEVILRVRPEPTPSVEQQAFTMMKPTLDAEILSERLKSRLDPIVIDKILEDTKVKDKILIEGNTRVVDRLEPIQDTQVPTNFEEDGGTEPFSTFLRKLVKVLVSKDSKDLEKLIKPFERYIVTLLDGRKLMKLGIVTGSFIAQLTRQIRAPVGVIQRFLSKVQISLENRRRAATDDINAMLDELDDVYDVSEEEAMQRVLLEATMFPNTRRHADQIVQDFVDDVFLHPMQRVAGTSRGNVVFENIAKVANKFNIPNARRYGRHAENAYIVPFSVSGDIFKKDTSKNKRGINVDSDTTSIKNSFKNKEDKRKRRRQMIIDLDSSENSDYIKPETSSDERGEVEIRIRINNAKHLAARKLKRNFNETIARFIRNRVRGSYENINKKNTEKINMFSESSESTGDNDELENNRKTFNKKIESESPNYEQENQSNVNETIARYIHKRVRESYENRKNKITKMINIFTVSSESTGENDELENNREIFNKKIESESPNDEQENQRNVNETIARYIPERLRESYENRNNINKNKIKMINIFTVSESAGENDGFEISRKLFNKENKSKRQNGEEYNKRIW